MKDSEFVDKLQYRIAADATSERRDQAVEVKTLNNLHQLQTGIRFANTVTPNNLPTFEKPAITAQ